jgi:hypothetical protein
LPDCPPKTAKSEDALFYRLIKGTTPVETDFLSHAELHPNRKDYAVSCSANALSLVPTIEDAIKLKKKHPKGFGNHNVVSIQVARKDGRLLRDKPDHASLWRSNACSVMSLVEKAIVETHVVEKLAPTMQMIEVGK